MTFFRCDPVKLSRQAVEDGRFDDRWTRGRLTDAEHGWLELRRLEAERTYADDNDRPSRRMPSRMVKAVDRWSVESGHVADGLVGATVTVPPSRSNPDGGRSGSGPSDPTGGVLDAVLASVDREVVEFVHLAGICRRDGTHDPHNRSKPKHICPRDNATMLGRLVGLDLDPSHVIDELEGRSPMSTGWPTVVQAMQTWHTVTASQIKDAFYELWGTTEPSVLEDVVSRTETIARKMAGIAGRLAQWSERVERRCSCGCGAAAPPSGQGATSEACRQRRSRAARRDAS